MSTLKYILFGTGILFSQSLISIWDIFVNLLDLISNLTLVLFFILEIGAMAGPKISTSFKLRE